MARYAQYVCELLGGELRQAWIAQGRKADMEAGFRQAAADSDLVILGGPGRSFVERLLAVHWVGRLAQAGEAAVSILAVVPTLPAMYSLGNHVRAGLDVLLAPMTRSGAQLRCLAQQLASWEVEGDLHLRQGEPGWQIRWEVAEGNYDLIVIAAEPYGRLRRWLFGDLISPLLHWIDRPLLIAKPS